MSETYETLKFERDGAVAIVTLHRPQAGNAIDVNMARDLLHVAILCDRDAGVRAVLLRSEGKLLPNPMISHGPRMRCFELIELQVKQSAILTVPPKSTHLSNAPWMPQLIRAEKCKTSYVVRVS